MKRIEYYAFISYNREDEKWAKWLQDKLEGYKLPTAICKEDPNLPQRVRPIFRDKTDLGGGSLRDSLQKELEDARFLIVICSPKAAKSHYVNYEIEHFINIGREQNIIPFVVSGTPNSKNDDNECFPSILKTLNNEPLGISITEIGKEQAFIKVIAALLNLKFDQLWQRHKRSQKRKQKNRLIVIGLLTTILLSSIFIYWDNNRVKIKYYADYNEVWGIPEGVCRLTEDDILHRHVSYLFEYHNYKLQKVKIIGSNKQLKIDDNQENSKRFSEVHFEYRDNNKLALKVCFNVSGKMVERYRFSEDLKIVDIVSADGDKAQTLNSGLTSYVNYNNQSNIIRFLNEYYNNGRLKKQTFASDPYNTPAADGNGIFGMEYNYYPNGQLHSAFYLDEFGKRTMKSSNLSSSFESKKEYFYNKRGWLEKTAYYDLDDQLVVSEWGCCILVEEYDKWGNVTEMRYLNRIMELMPNKQGVAIDRITWDKFGNLIERSYYDRYAKPIQGIFGYAKLTKEYDYKLNTSKTKYYNERGKLVLNKEGYAIEKTIYKSSGVYSYVTKEFYDNYQHPCMLKEGKFFAQTWYYDNYGNNVMITYEDTNRVFCNSNLGYKLYKAEYKNNLRVKEIYAAEYSTPHSLDHQ